MLRELLRARLLIAALGLSTMTGCGIVDDKPTQPDPKPARSKAKADCAGGECRVTVTCRSGRRHVLIGPAPVRVRSQSTLLRTAITADFAGSRDDKLIRC